MMFNKLREVAKVFFSKNIINDILTVSLSLGLDMKSSNFGGGNILVFDPGVSCIKKINMY